MGIGMSIFLFAVGAILRFAVNVQTDGFNLHAIGDILMLVGAIGALFSLIFWTSWGGFNNRYVGGARRDTIVRDEPRTVVREVPEETVVVERSRPRRTIIERERRA